RAAGPKTFRVTVNARVNPGSRRRHFRRGCPMNASPKLRAKRLEWRPMHRNTLRGFTNIELPIGLVIRDICVHKKNGRIWASLPARPVLDADRKHVVNHAGRKQFAALLGWRDRDLADRFSAAVVDLLRAERPEALS